MNILDEVRAGAADVSVVLRALNASDGTPVTSFAHDTSGIDLWYWRPGATKTSITEAALAALDSAHTDGGVEFIGDGYFRLDLPDAAVASGVSKVMVGGSATDIVIVGGVVLIHGYDRTDTPPTATEIATAVAENATIAQGMTDAATAAMAATAAELASEDIQTRIPAALTADGNIKADGLAINGDATAAANLAKTTRAIGRGTAAAAGSATSIPTSAFSLASASAEADQFKGRIITFDADTTTAALRGQSTDITANTSGATPTFTVTALTEAPAEGDTFSVT